MSGIIKTFELASGHINNSLKNLFSGSKLRNGIFIVLVIAIAAANLFSMFGYKNSIKESAKNFSTIITSLIIILSMAYWKYNFIPTGIFYAILFILLIAQQILIVAESSEGTKIQFDSIIFTMIIIFSAISLKFEDGRIIQFFASLVIIVLIILFFVFNSSSFCPNTGGYTGMLTLFGIIIFPFVLVSILQYLRGKEGFARTLIFGSIISIMFFTFYLTPNIDNTQKLLACNGSNPQPNPNKHLPNEYWYDQIKMPQTDISQDLYDKVSVNTNNFATSKMCGDESCDDLWNKVSSRNSIDRLTKDNIDEYLNGLKDKPSMLKYILYQLLKCGLVITGGVVPTNFGTWEWIRETWFANPMQGFVYVFALILYSIFGVLTLIGLFKSGSSGFALASVILGFIIFIVIIVLTSVDQTSSSRTGLIIYPFVVIGIMIILMIIARLTDISAIKNSLIVYILAVIIGFNLYYTLFIPPMMVVLAFLQKLVLQTSIGFGSATSILNTVWKFGIMLAAIIYASVSTALSSDIDTAGTGNALTWVVAIIIFFLIILNIVDSGAIKETMSNKWMLVLMPFAGLLSKIGGVEGMDLGALSIGL